MKIAKTSLLILLMLPIALFSSQKNEDNLWLIDYKKALLLSKKESKPVLMHFSGSDWCANCIRLEKVVFSQKAFLDYAKKHFILLKLDFPVKKRNKLPEEVTKQNEALADKYNKAGTFPTIILLDANEKILGTTGYKTIGVEEYIRHLNSFL